MANFGIEVEIKPVITIDEGTADTLLNLIRIYCRNEGKIVCTGHNKDNDVVLYFDEDEGKKNDY